MKRHIPTLIAALMLPAMLPISALAQTPPAAPANPYLVNIPGITLPNISTYLGLIGSIATFKPSMAAKPYSMSASLPREQKKALMQGMMAMMPSMGIRDAMSFMSTKYKAKDGLTFDEVVQSMELRANVLNFKKVGHSPMWKDIQAVLGDKEAPRMEVFHYCDIAAGREVLRAAPETIAYLPCRIAIMEDANKAIWVITLDWDLAWLDTVQSKMGINPELSKYANDIQVKMDSIMQAAANGEL
ncbi:MAG: hypothetical protein COW48_06855 [Hydrogenophilales bacterium CG17_big_fil_post_rev_8_21_14_2_50_63_12]|nr:MAG: hypothetical protein COW48_06855 [Hydrogenophilales bacterium CG17_big_fil_post_rev_8_21_14_2_50_63_12]PIX96642.1 MAG: hypothetical protein COZ24_09440 [Hydrogenophilales bacterium CG_4_10_14_3_um_filter_63_21]